MMPPRQCGRALRPEPVSFNDTRDDDRARRDELVESCGEIVAVAGLAGKSPLLQDAVSAERPQDAHPEHFGFTKRRVKAGAEIEKPDEPGINKQRRDDADRSGTPVPITHNL